MSPQPYLSVRPVKGAQPGVRWHVNVLDERPELAALAMQVIGVWANIEISYVYLTAIFLKSDVEVVSRMLLGISPESQRAAIRMAAESVLTTDDYRLFQAVLRVSDSFRTRRNKYAHGTWGISEGHPECLVWIDPKEMAKQFASLTALRHGMTDSIHHWDYGKVYLYSMSDIENDRRDGLKAEALIRDLSTSFGSDDTARASRARLLEEPQVRQSYFRDGQSSQRGLKALLRRLLESLLRSLK